MTEKFRICATGGMGYPYPYLMPIGEPSYNLDKIVPWQVLEGKHIVKVICDDDGVILETNMSKSVNDYKRDEEFLKLEAELGQLLQKEDEIWAILQEKFPAPEGMTWCLMANHKLMVRAKYGEQ